MVTKELNLATNSHISSFSSFLVFESCDNKTWISSVSLKHARISLINKLVVHTYLLAFHNCLPLCMTLFFNWNALDPLYKVHISRSDVPFTILRTFLIFSSKILKPPMHRYAPHAKLHIWQHKFYTFMMSMLAPQVYNYA